MARDYRRWSDEEIQTLLWWWGEEDPALTAQRLSRSLASCRQRIGRIRHTCAALDNFTSMTDLRRRTGFGRLQLHKAIKDLGIEIPRRGKTVWLLTDEQAKQITDHLSKQQVRWSKKYVSCRQCRSKAMSGLRMHHAKGLCGLCYQIKWGREKKEKAHETT